AWSTGRLLGTLVGGPLFMVWIGNVRAGFDVKSLWVRELCVTYTLLILVSIGVYGNIIWPNLEPSASAYMIYPPLIWIALQYRQIASVLAVYIASFIALTCTIVRLPSFFSLDLAESVYLLQRFLGITAITFLIISALVEERVRAEQKKLEALGRNLVLLKEKSNLTNLNKAKNEFIALASHQLRTPVSGIKVNLGMLLDGMIGKLTRAQSDRINAAYQFNERQLNIIEGLLDIAQLDMANVVIKKKKVNMEAIISHAIHAISPKIAERHQTIEFIHDDTDHKTDVDPDKFTAVIENLLDNASKYSPDGKKIEVKLFNKNHKQTVSISDQGVGIAKRDINKLFKKFSRIKNDLSETGNGTGLGLYWVKKIVILHGGKISVASTPGRGTVFTIRL
ncbi:MAG TPA: HAMP domain-containing sensor histidine kinase, partial [Candidatus Bathyarchaeia archaeon]|nr:HAMP domain-containing sensor histidine kinase [Candidatus Bathyarchaeia archaeon]